MATRFAPDGVDAIHARRRFFPKLLITINPHYERGASVEALPLDFAPNPNLALKITNPFLPSSYITKGEGRAELSSRCKYSFAFRLGAVRRSHEYDV